MTDLPALDKFLAECKATVGAFEIRQQHEKLIEVVEVLKNHAAELYRAPTDLSRAVEAAKQAMAKANEIAKR